MERWVVKFAMSGGGGVIVLPTLPTSYHRGHIINLCSIDCLRSILGPLPSLEGGLMSSGRSSFSASHRRR
jgi:hypothetical protein